MDVIKCWLLLLCIYILQTLENHGCYALRVCYSFDELKEIGVGLKQQRGMGSPATWAEDFQKIPKEITRRRRGKSGGVLKRLKSRRCRPYIPSIIMGNVQSIGNKMDELRVNAQFLHEFRSISLMVFTETWLSSMQNDELVAVDGFKTFRGDRTVDSGKQVGGGLIVYVNEQYCHPNNVSIKSHTCTPNSEILTVSVRPYYIPREFSHVVVMAIYVPHRTLAKEAVEEIQAAVHRVESASPDAFVVMSGDFNHCAVKISGSYYYQHVKCNTRGQTILDHCYSKVKDAYRSRSLPSLGKADHNLVLLCPKYVPLVQRHKKRTITVKKTTPEAIERLQDAFDTTDWSVFENSAMDINELTESVCDYINFCNDVVIEEKRVKVYANSKPWINFEIKRLINEKRKAFAKGDKVTLKGIQKELRREINKEKYRYKCEIENYFKENDMKKVWEGMRLMSGYVGKGKTDKTQLTGTMKYANDLNNFYNRFDKIDFSEERLRLRETIGRKEDNYALQTNKQEVYGMLVQLKATKAAGPDGLSPKVLKGCAFQLASIFSSIFNYCFSQNVLPDVWKQSCIIPVPKKKTIECMNDLRPVALTSIAMKVCEKIVLKNLRPQVERFLDPCQFAYQQGRGAEDAIVFKLDSVYAHLDRRGRCARILYYDFSSAFNTIQPHILVNKLMMMEVSSVFIYFILNFLENRSQFVKLNSKVKSEKIMTNTGSPQGTVLSPFLFTVYTADYRPLNANCQVVKFADDTALIGLIENDDYSHYQNEIKAFVKYCDTHYLELNVKKTKELVIDYRRNSMTTEAVEIKGSVVERVNSYRYLGVVFNDKLTWSDHLSLVMEKLSPRIYCLRKLQSFKVNLAVVRMFFMAVICSVWSYCVVGWGGNAGATEKARIDRVTRRVGKMMGESNTVDKIYEDRLASMRKKIIGDPTHPLHENLTGRVMERSGRLKPSVTRTNRYALSFIPQAIRQHNKHFKRTFP